MNPEEPPAESLLSKIAVIGALAVLLVIIGVCGYVVYGFLNQPQDPDPGATSTVTPTPVPAATPSPAASQQPTQQVTITPTPEPVYQFDYQITKGIKVLTPGIWGTFVVYDEMVGTDSYKVHLFSTISQIDDVIATGNVRSYGCIGSGKVGLLYEDDYRIMLYDLEGRTQTQATPKNVIPRMSPCIFENKLIYTANDGASNPATGWMDIFSLYEFEIADGNYNFWANPTLEPQEPRGDGSYVVWWQIDGDGRDIILFQHDSRPCKSTIISQKGMISDHPRIYGDTVVYHSNVGGTDHIYFYDITEGFTKKVTDTSEQYYADIYENRIVYDDNRLTNWNIFSYDLTTGQEQILTNEPHDQMMPQIYGSNVIYMDNRNYAADTPGWDLYLLQI